jgi:hypothetical protein
MRKMSIKTPGTFLAGLFVFVLTFSGCTKETKAPVSSQNESMLSSSVQANAAAVVNTNESIPTDLEIFIPCANGGAGELVTVSGFLHVTSSVIINGNHVRVKTHFQPQGLSGLGETTGDRYNATGVTQDEFSGSLVNGQFQETYVNNYKIIGQGTGNNYLVHETFHITVNAEGTVTTTIDNLSVECK